MKYTPQEVIQFIQEEDVKFIRLAFCDCFGRPKNISIMPHELERAFKYGIAIDASAIAGFGDEVNSDLFLHPDASTIALLPWRPEHGSVVRMFCSIAHPDGTPFAHDTRGILKQAVADAAKAGYAFSFGSELEFYLFRLDENGEVTDVPYDQATYMDVAPEDRCENVRREICLTLERMGIQPESSHHEEGPGQNEVDSAIPIPCPPRTTPLPSSPSSKPSPPGTGCTRTFPPDLWRDAPAADFTSICPFRAVRKRSCTGQWAGFWTRSRT